MRPSSSERGKRRERREKGKGGRFRAGREVEGRSGEEG
jgi:hypothetical protein